MNELMLKTLISGGIPFIVVILSLVILYLVKYMLSKNDINKNLKDVTDKLSVISIDVDKINTLSNELENMFEKGDNQEHNIIKIQENLSTLVTDIKQLQRDTLEIKTLITITINKRS